MLKLDWTHGEMSRAEIHIRLPALVSGRIVPESIHVTTRVTE
jgi:hypothetical protein